MPDCYVHEIPAPPTQTQRRIAERDIDNLAAVCAEIGKSFGEINYEMVILDDFTVYVWVQHPEFAIELFPNNFPDEINILKMFIEAPEVEPSECDCQTIAEVIQTLHLAIGK